MSFTAINRILYFVRNCNLFKVLPANLSGQAYSTIEYSSESGRCSMRFGSVSLFAHQPAISFSGKIISVAPISFNNWACVSSIAFT